jgi:hypothetical protein
MVPDFSKRQRILSSRVYCENKIHGCEFIDVLSRIDHHLCPYEQEECNECKEMVCNNQVEDHKKNICIHRKVPCEKCNKDVAHSNLEKHKEQECPMLETKCMYCEWEGILLKKEQHNKECIFMERPCPYEKYGCNEKITFLNKNEHDSKTDHVQITCRYMDELQTTMKKKLYTFLPDGPFKVIGHQHEVILCSDLYNETCSNCHFGITSDQGLYLGFVCKECNYSLCMDCFTNKRLFKSKHEIAFL